jgi:hypothetical protein
MGLDTTHNAWHGPYSSFNRFRNQLAKRIGIDLNDYVGYGPNGTKDLESIDHPLMDLFNHSDCDGELTPDQCAKIIEGLDMVIKDCPVPMNAWSEDYLFLSQAIRFRDGCKEAYEKQEVLEFR